MCPARSRSTGSASRRHAPVSLRWRVVWQAVLLTAFIIVSLTTLSFFMARSLLLQSVDARLSAFAAIGEDSLAGVLHQYRERTSTLASDAFLLPVLRSSDVSAALEQARLSASDDALHTLLLMDDRGTVRGVAGEMPSVLPTWTDTVQAVPVADERGWLYYDVRVPVRVQGAGRPLLLLARYDASEAAASLLPALLSLDSTAQMLFVSSQPQNMVLLLRIADDGQTSGKLIQANDHDLSLLRDAASGKEGTAAMNDEYGIASLVAYRYLPELGWGMVVQIDRDSALAGVRRLAITHAMIGTVLLLLAAAIASYLAGQVTLPLRHLAEKVRRLRPGHWHIRKTERTGDEVEVLDTVVVDLAGRLRGVYEHLEQAVEERTSALKKQSALDRAILSSIDYGVVTTDQRGMVTGMNPAASRLLQKDGAALRGQDITDVLHFVTAEGKRMRNEHPVRVSLHSKQVLHSSPTAKPCILRADGTALPVAYAAAPLRQDRRTFGAIIALQDVTEARHLDDLKSEFISLASHQLRTPLSALRWYVELLGEEKKLSADQQSYVAEMRHSINRMVTLLASLLHAAKLEGGDVHPSLQDTGMRALVQDTMSESKPLLDEAHLALMLHLPTSEVQIHTDSTLVRIILQNLISNAVKYSPGGTASAPKELHVELKRHHSGVCITVKDSGVGIPQDEQQHIFQKFFRGSNVRPLDTDGNGLGLHITHAIVERLGGSISFQSVQNEGTTFTVDLPGGRTSRTHVRKKKDTHAKKPAKKQSKKGKSGAAGED